MTNVGRQPFSFRRCPTYLQLLGGDREKWYLLNCRPVGILQPRQSARFAMRLHVPKDARVGGTSVFWLLGPKTYLPTTAVAPVLVTR